MTSCTICQTTETPMWRSGPAGPRSLCNACGLRHRKQQKADGMMTVMRKRKPKTLQMEEELRQPLLMALSEVAAIFEKLEEKKQLGEEEQAALLLISLSKELSPSST